MGKKSRKKHTKNTVRKPWVKRILLGAAKLLFLFLVASIGLVLLYRFVPVPVTILQLTRCVQQFENEEPIRLKKQWVPLQAISNNLQLAVVCAEDQKFLNHRGFDVKAIEKAIEHNRQQKRKRGASTISQQTAKNVFLWPSRTWVRKGLEVYFTVLIELFWSKQRILEVYLNVIEMGNGIYGAQAASESYFATSAKDLSPAQAALLASVLPNPREYSAIVPSNYVRKRQAWVLQQMKQWGGQLEFYQPK